MCKKCQSAISHHHFVNWHIISVVDRQYAVAIVSSCYNVEAAFGGQTPMSFVQSPFLFHPKQNDFKPKPFTQKKAEPRPEHPKIPPKPRDKQCSEKALSTDKQVIGSFITFTKNVMTKRQKQERKKKVLVSTGSFWSTTLLIESYRLNKRKILHPIVTCI